MSPTGDLATLEADLDRGFSWNEGLIHRWTAVALFGGLVFLEGLALWIILNGTIGGPAPRLPVLVVGLAVLLALGGLAAIFLGFTWEGLAFLGAAVTGLAVTFSVPLTELPAGYLLFTNPGPFGTDFAAILGLLVASAILLTVGVVARARGLPGTLRRRRGHTGSTRCVNRLGSPVPEGSINFGRDLRRLPEWENLPLGAPVSGDICVTFAPGCLLALQSNERRAAILSVGTHALR